MHSTTIQIYYSFALHKLPKSKNVAHLSLPVIIAGMCEEMEWNRFDVERSDNRLETKTDQLVEWKRMTGERFQTKDC